MSRASGKRLNHTTMGTEYTEMPIGWSGEEIRERGELLEHVEGTPVYDADADRYHADLQACIEDIGDHAAWEYQDVNGERPNEEELELTIDAILAGRLVFACSVDKVHTPDLIETVEESWNEEYEDPYGFGAYIPQVLRDQLVNIQAELERVAPTVWYPLYSKRVSLV